MLGNIISASSFSFNMYSMEAIDLLTTELTMGQWVMGQRVLTHDPSVFFIAVQFTQCHTL
jgi:hypothetical protein